MRGEHIKERHLLLGHYMNECRKEGLIGKERPGQISSDEVLRQVHKDIEEIETDIKRLKEQGLL